MGICACLPLRCMFLGQERARTPWDLADGPGTSCWPCCPGTGYRSTYNLVMTARPGGILEQAVQSQEFTEHLALFMDNTRPLDLPYVSLHTSWLHYSDIPQRSLRLTRVVAVPGNPGGGGSAPGAPGVPGVPGNTGVPGNLVVTKEFFMDDVLAGTWEFQPPVWLGLERSPGHTRWYEAAPGSGAFVHRSDNGDEPWWQVVLVPLLHDYTGDMRPVRD